MYNQFIIPHHNLKCVIILIFQYKFVIHQYRENIKKVIFIINIMLFYTSYFSTYCMKTRLEYRISIPTIGNNFNYL